MHWAVELDYLFIYFFKIKLFKVHKELFQLNVWRSWAEVHNRAISLLYYFMLVHSENVTIGVRKLDNISKNNDIFKELKLKWKAFLCGGN